MRDIFSADVPAGFAESFGLIESAHSRLNRQVGGLSQAELDYTGPAGNVNSTAMLVAHLAYTDLVYLHCIKGEPIPPDLDAEFGPFELEDGTLPRVTGKTAAELLERSGRVVGMVREYLKTQSDADAARAVKVPWWPEPASARFVLWHMASHISFHLGQIARLQAWYQQEH